MGAMLRDSPCVFCKQLFLSFFWAPTNFKLFLFAHLLFLPITFILPLSHLLSHSSFPSIFPLYLYLSYHHSSQSNLTNALTSLILNVYYSSALFTPSLNSPRAITHNPRDANNQVQPLINK